jgi:2-amino-4-hydroxy-6-hydroxymethyldihydropteridine diphosphokinase
MSESLWTPVYVGIGSNLDDPKGQVTRGIVALKGLSATKLIARSKLYLTKPLGRKDQPDYVNAVAGLMTQLVAPAMLNELKALEKKLGRTQPAERWGPRVIDFDLLVFGAERINSDTLNVPHPGIAERAFVLMPLMDIAPDLDIPGIGRLNAIAARIDATEVRAL